MKSFWYKVFDRPLLIFLMGILVMSGHLLIEGFHAQVSSTEDISSTVYVLFSQSMFLSITLYLHCEKQPKETVSIYSIGKTRSQNETLL